jgi:hypothetical protein
LKTIVKLVIMLAILNAVFRAGSAAWTYYEFKDAVQQTLLFGSRTPPSELHTKILAKAGEFEVPVTPENVSVQREDKRTWASVVYTEPVEFFPSYSRPITFRFTVEEIAVQ